ncbi:hypothetical protein [Desulfofalx alkaliphila]|uniref:hypothetical protein n=1 Tax=Desulfofalx alkaliphila TaxID=105483 RepID=UPI0012FF15D7|nr:hypothetical protein [Desulfofalx alkaliphila]
MPDHIKQGLCGAIAFASIFTVLQYILSDELNFAGLLAGLFGGACYFLSWVFFSSIRRKKR